MQKFSPKMQTHVGFVIFWDCLVTYNISHAFKSTNKTVRDFIKENTYAMLWICECILIMAKKIACERQMCMNKKIAHPLRNLMAHLLAGEAA